MVDLIGAAHTGLNDFVASRPREVPSRAFFHCSYILGQVFPLSFAFVLWGVDWSETLIGGEAFSDKKKLVINEFVALFWNLANIESSRSA